MSVKKIIYLYLFLVISCHSVNGQHTEWDLGMWNGVSLKMKWNKKLSSEVNFQGRWDQNISQLNTLFVDFGLSYELKKHLNLAGNFRSGVGDYIPVTDFYNRINVDILLSKPKKWLFHLKRTEFSLRLRGLAEWSIKNNLAQLTDYTFRSKLMIKYNIKGKPLNPFLAGELFVRLNQPYYDFAKTPSVIPELNKGRLKSGIEWDITKNHSLQIAYILQAKLYSLKMQSIISCSYSWKIVDVTKNDKKKTP